MKWFVHYLNRSVSFKEKTKDDLCNFNPFYPFNLARFETLFSQMVSTFLAAPCKKGTLIQRHLFMLLTSPPVGKGQRHGLASQWSRYSRGMIYRKESQPVSKSLAWGTPLKILSSSGRHFGCLIMVSGESEKWKEELQGGWMEWSQAYEGKARQGWRDWARVWPHVSLCLGRMRKETLDCSWPRGLKGIAPADTRRHLVSSALQSDLWNSHAGSWLRETVCTVLSTSVSCSHCWRCTAEGS